MGHIFVQRFENTKDFKENFEKSGLKNIKSIEIKGEINNSLHNFESFQTQCKMTNDKQTNNSIQTTYFCRTKDGHVCLHTLNNAFGRQVLELPRYLQLLSNFHPNPFLKMKSTPFSETNNNNNQLENQLSYRQNTHLFTFLLKSLCVVHSLINAASLEAFEENLDRSSTTGLLCISPHGVWSARKLDHSQKKWLLLDSSRFKPLFVTSSQLWDSEAQFIIIPYSHLFAEDVANEGGDNNQETGSIGSGSSGNTTSKTKTKKMRKAKSAPIILSLSSHNLAMYNNFGGEEDLSRESSYATSESSLDDQPDNRHHYSSLTLPRPNRFVVLYQLSPNI
eukprot:TRINITY_DN812_c0_g1_i2.p1 TRINITY_DN812_c0_g1~~TRINITY_DN812_c0_g1_i2.p1  ORF type:complete len:335 (-),score=98.71 TRINITY_DN812_c0_g1_i2:51-1055(-)